ALASGKTAFSNSQAADSKRSVPAILFSLEESYHVSFNYDDAAIRKSNLEKDFSWDKNEQLENVLKRLTEQAGLKFEKVDEFNYLIFPGRKEPSAKKGSATSALMDPGQPPSVLAFVEDKKIEAFHPAEMQISGVVRDELSN